jgi:Pentapeptide repeats (8 copies)
MKALGILGAIILAATPALATSLAFRSSQQSAKATERSLAVTERGVAAERLKNGIDDLDAQDEYVQAGGILLLAQLARDSSTSDADVAYDIVHSFVRGNLCRHKYNDAQLHGDQSFVGPPAAVATGLRILRNVQRKIDLQRLGGCDRADLLHVDLTGADLTGVRLSGVNLEGSTFDHAIFHCADLNTADFDNGSDFNGADFTGADISNAGFVKAKHLTPEQLRSAYWDLSQTLPDVDPDKQTLIRAGPSQMGIKYYKLCHPS